VSSAAQASRRAVTVTFSAEVSAALSTIANRLSRSMSATDLVSDITTAAQALGLAIPLPSASDVQLAAPIAGSIAYASEAASSGMPTWALILVILVAVILVVIVALVLVVMCKRQASTSSDKEVEMDDLQKSGELGVRADRKMSLADVEEIVSMEMVSAPDAQQIEENRHRQTAADAVADADVQIEVNEAAQRWTGGSPQYSGDHKTQIDDEDLFAAEILAAIDEGVIEKLVDDFYDTADKDGSGTLNSKEELMDLTSSICAALELEHSIPEIEEMCCRAGLSDSNTWSKDAFKAWFQDNF